MPRPLGGSNLAGAQPRPSYLLEETASRLDGMTGDWELVAGFTLVVIVLAVLLVTVGGALLLF
jgi:hypothetical protein